MQSLAPKFELVSRNEIFVAPADIPEFDAMQSALIREFAPATEFQRQALKTLIHSLWTLRRTRILEATIHERSRASGALDPLLDPAWAKQLDKVLALRRHAQRDHNRALKDLQSAKRTTATNTQEPQPQPTAAAAAAKVLPFPAAAPQQPETPAREPHRNNEGAAPPETAAS